VTGSMRALVWAGGTTVAVEDRPRPQTGDGQVLVDVAWCGLCGTDLHICAGEHPRARPGTVLGHELSGRLHHGTGELAAGTKVVVDPLVAAPAGRAAAAAPTPAPTCACSASTCPAGPPSRWRSRPTG
jgi:(R,R)-butanediol dehydrogenase / meso-butanediol dehydrogenase / diacetyl reductase